MFTFKKLACFLASLGVAASLQGNLLENVDFNVLPQEWASKLSHVEHLHQMPQQSFSKGTKITHLNGNLTVYSLVPTSANLDWKLELFDLTGDLTPHSHKIQNQLVFIIEGKLTVRINDTQLVLLPGQYAMLPAGVVHNLGSDANAGCRFLVLDMPGYEFPEDVYFEQASLSKPSQYVGPQEIDSRMFVDQSIQLDAALRERLKVVKPFDQTYSHTTLQRGKNVAHFIVPGNVTDGRWNLAVLELNEGPKHFHITGTERYVVLQGELLMQVDGVDYRLLPGHVIRVSPQAVHSFRSATDQPVLLLGINHPAFTETDFHITE